MPDKSAVELARILIKNSFRDSENSSNPNEVTLATSLLKAVEALGEIEDSRCCEDCPAVGIAIETLKTLKEPKP